MENDLTVKSNKTKIMTFGSRAYIKKTKDVEIFIDNQQIKSVPSYKYLDINLDQTLNFKHI